MLCDSRARKLRPNESYSHDSPSTRVAWLRCQRHGPLLMNAHGVGPKTVNFLKLLVGLDAIAVDRQILRFVRDAGVDLKTADLVEAILTKAGAQLGLTGAQVDQLVWRSKAAGDKRTRTKRRSR